MTGAGKTHTMLGDIYRSTTGEEGICTMATEEIFHMVRACSKECKVKMSYLEIYNEHVIDLLATGSRPTPENPPVSLMIVEDPIKGVYVPDLTEYEVHNSKELLELVLKGNQRRTMAETSTNQFSSRSHAILQISVESSGKNVKGVSEILTSKLSLVDLAGSERASNTENKGLRMLEGGKINKSLLALGNCINILSDKTKAATCFVPYRDSKLTRLLKDSLGGNTKTIMIACVAPGGNCFEETVNTLKYAERARKIKKVVNRNAKEIELTTAQYKEIVESLKSEIASLKDKITIPQINSPSTIEYPPVVVKHSEDISIKELEQQISQTKAMKDKCQEELMRDSSEVMQSLKASHCEIIEDDTHLYKLSQELLSKYEEHYEMKQSVQELTDLNLKNQKKLQDLQNSLDECVRAKISEDLTKEQQDKTEQQISQITHDIETLQKIIESNESIKHQIEDSLKENSAIQQKYLALVTKLQSHKKKDILELQISVRTLKLEKMELLMQNLEIKKEKRLKELENQGKDQQLASLREELDLIKTKLKQKEKELLNSASKIKQQKNEIEMLKGKSCLSDPQRKIAQRRTMSKGQNDISIKSEIAKKNTGYHQNNRYLALSFSKPGEKSELNKELVQIDDDFDYYEDNYECSAYDERLIIPSDIGIHKNNPPPTEPTPINKFDNHVGEGGEESFISLSSVTCNNEDNASNTDIELVQIENPVIPSAKNSPPPKPAVKQFSRRNSFGTKNPLNARNSSGYSNMRNTPKDIRAGGYFSKMSANYGKLLNRMATNPVREQKTVRNSPKPKLQNKVGSDFIAESMAQSTRNLGPNLLPDSHKYGVINLYNITQIQNATNVNIAQTPSGKQSVQQTINNLVSSTRYDFSNDSGIKHNGLSIKSSKKIAPQKSGVSARKSSLISP